MDFLIYIKGKVEIEADQLRDADGFVKLYTRQSIIRCDISF